MPKNHTLSVVLATFNEEENIRRCLESVRDLADEVVIVDGASQDKTVPIAKEMGARVIITENHPNFHINKQKAIDAATNDWILQLDADEVVSKEQAGEITHLLSQKEIDKNGYWMPRKNYFLGRFLLKGGQYPDYTLRLYRRGKGRLPQKDVHEQAVVEGKVGYLQNALLHYPYKDFAAYYAKWKRYTLFFARQLKDELSTRNFLVKLWSAVYYLVFKPLYWFLWTYIRHKGFMDLWPGFVFSFFSSLRYPVAFMLYLQDK